MKMFTVDPFLCFEKNYFHQSSPSKSFMRERRKKIIKWKRKHINEANGHFLFNEVEKYFIDTSGNLKMKESARGRVFLDMCP